jgi:outer membrane protein assembly factor BamB
MVAFTMLAGCQTNPPAPPGPSMGPIGVGSFVEQWQAPLALAGSNQLTDLVYQDNVLFVTTDRNSVYAIDATGGKIEWVHQVGNPDDQLRKPYMPAKGITVVPAGSTLVEISGNGRNLKTIEIGHSVRSSLAGSANFVYAGLDYANGGHLARIDLSLPLNNVRWELMTRAGISATPVLFGGVIYAGGEDGNVYAVNESRLLNWPDVFKTAGPILADVKADTFGVYVASMDSKLYCIDIGSGKIKWTYFSGTGLNADSTPQVTNDSVYVYVPGNGVAAIDKTTGDPFRKPRWTVVGTKQFLAEDEQNVYLRGMDNSIIGVDKKTGDTKLHSQRHDLIAFASNTKTDMIYAATAEGQVIGIKAVTKAGVVGRVVKADFAFEQMAAAK